MNLYKKALGLAPRAPNTTQGNNTSSSLGSKVVSQLASLQSINSSDQDQSKSDKIKLKLEASKHSDD